MKTKFIFPSLLSVLVFFPFRAKSQNYVDVYVTQPPALQANAGNDVLICLSGNSTIGGTPTASGGSSGYSYVWTPPTGLSSATVANPTATPTDTTTYTVVVTDAFGCTESSSITIFVDNCTGISQYNTEMDISLFPNPTNKYLTLAINGYKFKSVLTLTIISELGQTVLSESLQITANNNLNKQIDVSAYLRGRYILTISDNQSSYTKKFVKN